MKEHSAGGVVYRLKEEGKRKKEKGAIEWLVCKHSGYHKWVLPKGIVEEGETPRKTAVREVLEETGIRAKIVGKITPVVKYKYMKQGTLINKRVEFYLMKFVSGDIKDHCWEMEEVKWVATDEGLRLLRFPTEQKILRQTAKLLE